MRNSKGQADSKLPQRRSSARTSRSSWHASLDAEKRNGEPPAAQYAVLLSCRCNYTGIRNYISFGDNMVIKEKSILMVLIIVESKLFFKHPTSWQPRIAGDLMISVASGISRRTLAADGTQLPVQVIYGFQQSVFFCSKL